MAQGTTNAAHTAEAGFFFQEPAEPGRLRFFPAAMSSLDEQKQALRVRMRKAALKPGSPEHVSASLAAQKRLAEVAVESGARMVALYRALPSECGTAELATELEAAGREVCYPAVAAGELGLRYKRSSGVFVAGALGIEEPAGPDVPLDRIELLVVPALAVDTAGRRLGRGKGHYDATLALYQGPSVALVFDSQLVPEVPVGEHDRRVGAVCTDLRWIRVL
jgi:5-formyltetrahydrofolate cyclo-ligase